MAVSFSRSPNLTLSDKALDDCTDTNTSQLSDSSMILTNFCHCCFVINLLHCFSMQEEDVSEMNTDEISQLLEKHGLPKSAEARSEVPEEPDEPEELEEPEEPEEEELEEGETEEYDDDDEEDDVTDHTEL